MLIAVLYMQHNFAVYENVRSLSNNKHFCVFWIGFLE